MAPTSAAPEAFTRAVAGLRAAAPREEILLEEIAAPQRLAPWGFALSATVLRDGEEMAREALQIGDHFGPKEDVAISIKRALGKSVRARDRGHFDPQKSAAGNRREQRIFSPCAQRLEFIRKKGALPKNPHAAIPQPIGEPVVVAVVEEIRAQRRCSD